MHILKYLSVVIIYFICLIASLIGAARAWQVYGERTVQANDPAQITDAVMITDIEIAGRSIEAGLFIRPPAVVQPVSPFQAEDTWLQTMTISLINRTSKTIVSGQITLNFLDTGNCRSQPCVMEHLTLGEIPAIDAYNGRTEQPLRQVESRGPIDWEPDQTVVVHVADYMNEIIQNLGDHLAVTSVTKVAIHLGAFFFKDGMRWVGTYSIPDPDHLGRFKPLPRDYFPGRRNHHWPPGYDR